MASWVYFKLAWNLRKARVNILNLQRKACGPITWRLEKIIFGRGVWGGNGEAAKFIVEIPLRGAWLLIEAVVPLANMTVKVMLPEAPRQPLTPICSNVETAVDDDERDDDDCFFI